jgi:hypothetical protein
MFNNNFHPITKNQTDLNASSVAKNSVLALSWHVKRAEGARLVATANSLVRVASCIVKLLLLYEDQGETQIFQGVRSHSPLRAFSYLNTVLPRLLKPLRNIRQFYKSSFSTPTLIRFKNSQTSRERSSLNESRRMVLFMIQISQLT